MIHSPTSGDELLVGAAVAPLHAEPRIASEQISQRVRGQRVTVLLTEREWARVRGDDAYEGWMHRGYLHDGADAEATRCSLGCLTRDAAGVRRVLPPGAWLLSGDVLEAGEALEREELPERFPATRDAIARTALELFPGAPYEWGGVTPWGADCSGFVQTLHRLHGIRLPRDARLQAELGEHAGSVEQCQPADLLFFSERDDGRITHVGVALGGGRMAHLALGRGGFAVDSLSSPADDYAATLVSRFRFARTSAASR